MNKYPNPLIPGFNPDPSIVEHEGVYHLVTSTFEYFPGIPIYKSSNLVDWTLIGHVATRPGQLQGKGIYTAGGTWAPTIRFHDGLFYVAVTETSGRGTVIFTAEDPAGDWSDGIETDIEGIDPDLAWDETGQLYVTFSGLILSGPKVGTHLGIQQSRLDLETGKMLEEPRDIWSGTGLMFPEAPHLYKIGDYWYLLIAEGGTERGHAVSIARSKSIEGPFEGAPNNPILSARSTARPVQNTGHGDLAIGPDGNWVMVMLGMRTRGLTRAFSTLGRESFITNVTWDSEGWPVVEPVELNQVLPEPEFFDDFSAGELNGEWISMRQFPSEVSKLSGDGLVISSNGQTMDGQFPAFVGRRVRLLQGLTTARLKTSGVGGISLRYDEVSHYDLELKGHSLLVRSRLSHVELEIEANEFDFDEAADTDGFITLAIRYTNPQAGFGIHSQTSDLIELGWMTIDGELKVVKVLDGRYLTAEVTCSFTGRVLGCYSSEGTTLVREFSEASLK